MRDWGCRSVLRAPDPLPKAIWMNRKASIVLRSLVALTIVSGLMAPAKAALVRIVHLDCAQWHARLALLADRKAHPHPQNARHFAGRRHRVRIHFVCDCKDGAAEEFASEDDLGGGAPGGLSGAPESYGASAFSILGSSSGSSTAFGGAASFAATSGAAAGGSGSGSVPGSWLPPIALGPVGPGGVGPFDPTNPPSGSFPPLDPTQPIPAVPEPSTWLLFGLAAAALLAMKRRSDASGQATRSCGWRLWRKPA